MNITKNILLVTTIFMGMSTYAIEQQKSAQLTQIDNILEKYLHKNVAHIITDYIDYKKLYLGPTTFIKFSKLPAHCGTTYQQINIIEAFGMISPDAECAYIVRYLVSDKDQISKLAWIPLHIINGKKDEQPVYTAYGDRLGYLAQKESGYGALDALIEKSTKKTHEFRSEDKSS